MNWGHYFSHFGVHRASNIGNIFVSKSESCFCGINSLNCNNLIGNKVSWIFRITIKILKNPTSSSPITNCLTALLIYVWFYARPCRELGAPAAPGRGDKTTPFLLKLKHTNNCYKWAQNCNTESNTESNTTKKNNCYKWAQNCYTESNT